MNAIKAVGLVLVILCAPFLDQASAGLAQAFRICALPRGRAVEFKGPFPGYGGVAYFADFPALEALSDDAYNPPAFAHSAVRGAPAVGPRPFADVADLGKGRFSHWGPHIIFTASDNSNPNTNGRKYAAVKMDYVLAFTWQPVETPTLAGLVFSFITGK